MVLHARIPKVFGLGAKHTYRNHIDFNSNKFALQIWMWYRNTPQRVRASPNWRALAPILPLLSPSTAPALLHPWLGGSAAPKQSLGAFLHRPIWLSLSLIPGSASHFSSSWMQNKWALSAAQQNLPSSFPGEWEVDNSMKCSRQILPSCFAF